MKQASYTNQQLSGQPYLLGETFTVADAYLFTVLRWCRFIGLDLATWPNLSAFQERMNNRPAVQAVLKAEGLKT